VAADLERDVRRAILLGAYVRAWGVPINRSLARRGSEIIEVYAFPGRKDERVNRFATVGVSALRRDGDKLANWELLLVVPADNGGASEGEVISFLVDTASYSLRSDVRFNVGQTIPPSPLLPSCWGARALLLDDPRGEAAELSDSHVGIQHIKLVWLVPIHTDERDLILSRGIEAFDHAEAATQWSLADPNRPSVLAKQ